MEKKQIEEYIRKLSELNEIIGETEDNDELIDENFMNEFNQILNALDQSIETNSANTRISAAIPIKIKKLRDDAVIPKYSKDGDAGMDLTITHIISEDETSITYGYGIAIEIPYGYVGLVFPRSSIRNTDLLNMSNSVGVIDSGYRGEIQSTFNKKTFCMNAYIPGDRGAQLIIIPYPQIQFIESDELSSSERNTGGFGSTGK